MGSTGAVPPTEAGNGASGARAGSDGLGGGLIVTPHRHVRGQSSGEAGQSPETAVDHSRGLSDQAAGLALFARILPVVAAERQRVRKHQLERDVAGARTGRARVGDREQTRQPRAIVARRCEGWSGKGFGVSNLQGAKLPGCFESVCGQRICGNDEGGFGAFERLGNADPQANIAARQDQMLSVAIVECSERFGVLRQQVTEAFNAAFNKNGRGQALGRPVRGGCGGGCVGPDRESSGPIARPDPPVR